MNKEPEIVHRYGIFDLPYMNEVHMIPCTKEGSIIAPHITDAICICEPVIESDGHIYMIIHNSFH